MSALIVSDETITGILLVSAPRYPGDSATYRYQGEARYINGRLQDLGQILVNQNRRSVNHLYSRDDPAHTYRFRSELVPQIESVQIIKLCDCYIYQSSETPDWLESEAFAIVNALRERAIDLLPGYEEALWGL